ncbi:hypothetical protein E4T47_00661 [Aureobasidium subglaciale]|nr:hypothetical protein E4T43_01302 [Aureobasidium subglaciale]KAI5276357.1 hypothetical protein E4T47_00661 [Aureobasidium subglaciale]
MTNKQHSENEIWDDSALVQSWNEALEEYKKYHSMSARGERVEDVLDVVEKEEQAQATANLKNETIDTATGLPPWETIEEDKELAPKTSTDSTDVSVGAQAVNAPVRSTPPGVSQVLLDSVQDENLKALMTSWYFAGYYTGLYEGQRKAQADREHAAH